MSIFWWAITGLLAGGLGRRVVGTRKRGCLPTMLVGLIGAWVGGGIYKLVRGNDFHYNDFDFASIFVAFIGAVAFLFLLQAIEGRSDG
jgi:uncharacterized membrane protein YeaQ/YmgE (transglycosylase-associated protein family)